MWSCFVPPSPGRTAQLQPTARPYFAPQETQSLPIQGPSLKPMLRNSSHLPRGSGSPVPREIATSLFKNGLCLVLLLNTCAESEELHAVG